MKKYILPVLLVLLCSIGFISNAVAYPDMIPVIKHIVDNGVERSSGDNTIRYIAVKFNHGDGSEVKIYFVVNILKTKDKIIPGAFYIVAEHWIMQDNKYIISQFILRTDNDGNVTYGIESIITEELNGTVLDVQRKPVEDLTVAQKILDTLISTLVKQYNIGKSI